MKTTEELAIEADSIMDLTPYDLVKNHGMEVAPGFFTLYNHETGQSKTVLYHPESNLVFKESHQDVEAVSASGKHLGWVTWNDVKYRVRLPKFEIFEINGNLIAAQEYVAGSRCDCKGWGECTHSGDVRRASGCPDSHFGNWKIVDREVILFDFDGTPLKDFC